MVMFLVRHPKVGDISQLIRFYRVFSKIDDFNTRNKVLTAKLLREGYDIIKFIRRFQNFIGDILT